MTTWTNLDNGPRVKYGDAFPSSAFPHAKDLAGIFLPYGAAFCVTSGALIGGLLLPDNSIERFILCGAGLAGCAFVGFIFRMACHQVEREWILHEDERRALIVPVKPARIPFPPMRFVNFIWEHRLKSDKFPTVDQCEAEGFNRQLVQEWYTQMVIAGAIVNRRPKQEAGDPAWSRDKFEQAAKADNSLP